MFWAAFLVSWLLAAPEQPAGLPAPGSVSEVSGSTRTLSITLEENKSLDPAIAALLPVSVAAAFELSEGYQVVSGEEGADWELELSISGKGPWKVRARALPKRDKKAKRLSQEVSLADVEQITQAAGTLVAGLHAAGLGAGDTLAVPRLADLLSSSTAAVEAYLSAQGALRSGAMEDARASLDLAMNSDPGFALAAAERLYFDLTRGDEGGESRRDPAGGSAQDRILAGLTSLSRGDGEGALEIAEELLQTHPDWLWAGVLRGLSLSGMGRSDESVVDWTAVASARPNDPRAKMWLGRALFATGDVEGAAGAFRDARELWPALLRAYSLEAEAQVRLRETMAARLVLNEMRRYMETQGIVATTNDLHTGLMLGSVDFLEGHFKRALVMFEQETDVMIEANPFSPPALTLQKSIIEMRRDLAGSPDPVIRERQIGDARAALERYESLLPAEELERHPYELLRFKALLSIKLGNLVEAWKYVEELKSHREDPDYSEYYEAYVTAAIMVTEGDIEGCLEQFERAAEASGRVAHLMDVARRQRQLGRFPETYITLEEMERRLAKYDASRDEYSDLILADPHLAALVPLYHYFRAQFSFRRGDATDSRRHFNYMLKYLQEPDEMLLPMVEEAVQRGARPE